MWRPLQLLKKWENSKRGIITGSLGCQNSPICHVKVCYGYISQASPPIDYSTKNCSKQQQGDKFFSLFVYITCYFVIDHLNVIGWLNEDHSVFQKEELWLANICLFTEYTPFYYIRIFSNTGLPVLWDKKMTLKLQAVHIRKCLVLCKSCLDEKFNDPPPLLQEVPHQNVNQKCKVWNRALKSCP